MIYVALETQDAFAEGLAMDLPVREAADRAGYSPNSNSVFQWRKRPEFIAHIEKRRRALNPGSTPDLEPVIKRLIAAADNAAGAKDAPTLRAVRDLLAEAAKLKQLLPAPDTPAPVTPAPVTPAPPRQEYEMTREAWLAAYGPKDPQ
jgi:phage terminase small subunit